MNKSKFLDIYKNLYVTTKIIDLTRRQSKKNPSKTNLRLYRIHEAFYLLIELNYHSSIMYHNVTMFCAKSMGCEDTE